MCAPLVDVRLFSRRRSDRNIDKSSGEAVMTERSDHDLITDVLVRYATGIDTRNWSLFRTCFTTDVHADYGAGVGEWNDSDDITEYMKAMHHDMRDTKHMLSNFVIDVDGDSASASTYVHAVLAVSDDPPVWYEVIGRYVDRLVRTDNEWRISERTFRPTRMLSSDAVNR
jgi:3-phenylpropionate/cinnamic acid dioxygenase small subunit